MSIVAFSGPVVAFGQGPFPDYNPEAGPSLSFAGWGLLDPRVPLGYEPGQNFGSQTSAFSANGDIITLNLAPPAAAAAAISAAANAVSGVAVALVGASGNGIVVGASVVNLLTGVSVTGLLAIGEATGLVSFGSAGTVQLWDPSTLLARAVSITGEAGGAGGAFSVVGIDIYGVPMHETITATAGATTTNGKKAWKYIQSVTPQFTDAHTYSVGTTDIIGFPLASSGAGDLLISYPAPALITVATNYLAGVTTVATAITGDVRGTLALATASNGANVITLRQQVLPQNLALANGPGGTAITGLFGVPQF